MPPRNAPAGIKPVQTGARPVAKLHVVGGMKAGEIDLAEAWDSMLTGRFASEQAFGQYLIQRQHMTATAQTIAPATQDKNRTHCYTLMTCPWSVAGRQPNTP